MLDGMAFVSPAFDLVAEALEGLTATPKTLPPKLFYDAEGVRLFQRITELAEYYPTRTERALLRQHARDIAAYLPHRPVTLVEYGACHEEKAAILMARSTIAQYVPIDVARSALDEIATRLHRSHPNVETLPIAADFLAPLSLPERTVNRPRLGFFAGSTIGNLEPAAAVTFLRSARHTLGAGALFLVGVDVPKEPDILTAAYNDRQGITAAFNLNLLVRLNREAGADFDLTAFDHHAIWNADEGRIEMHLVSRHRQNVQLGQRTIHFEAGETIHTENSYKHSTDDFQRLARRSGWEPIQMWTDRDRLFSLHLLASGTVS